MEQEPLEGEREGCEHTEEADSLVSSSTDSDRQTDEEEEEEAELSDESTGKPTDETAVKLVEGHPPNDELTEGHPPSDELAKDHPPDDELVETITVKCPPPGQESPPGSTQGVVHTSEDEMDCLC